MGVPRDCATIQYTEVHVNEAEKFFNLSKNQVKQAEDKLAIEKVDLALVANYAISVF